MPLLQKIIQFFSDAFTRLKQQSTQSTNTLQEADTTNTVIIERPEQDVQINDDGNRSYLLRMPPALRNELLRMKSPGCMSGSPLLDHAGNHSTLALLHINNIYFWGANKVQPALLPADLHT